MSPLVVQLTDDDANGVIDADDTPDVVFIHSGPGLGGNYEGRLTVVDGRTGREHFTAVPALERTGLAAGDIDADGLVELVAIEAGGGRLVAFENDGSLKWLSEPTPIPLSRLDAIGIADLDQDGSPEVFVGATVYAASGSLRWQGSAGDGAQFLGRVSHAVDLVPANPGLELVAGNTVYDASGGIVWRNGSLSDGWTAVADFDGDGDAEVALVSIGDVHLLDHTGTALGPLYSFGSTPSSQPVATDLDGDGDAELFLMQESEVRALDWTGGDWLDLWQQATQDPSRINGASAFDFDGDGINELIYHDMVDWYIFDGSSGDVLHQEPMPSATGIETPVVADIDNDCITEILVTGCSGAFGPTYPNEVRAYECSPAGRARPLWNQYAYHVSNVLDDGGIPQLAQAPWLAHNSWMGQVATAAGALPAAHALSPLNACEGDSVVLDGSASTGCSGGYEYRWLDDSGTVCEWSSNPECEVSPAASGVSYLLEVRCAGEPCVDTTEVVVERWERPAADAGVFQEVCIDQMTRVGGSPTASGGAGSYSYEWTSAPPGLVAPGEESLPNPRTLALTAPATFAVTVTDANGCQASAMVAIDVVVPDLPRSVGNTLRAIKDLPARDVILGWSTSDPYTVAFRLHRGWPKAPSYPVLGPDLPAHTYVDANVVADGLSHGYQVGGVNCAGIEGP